MILNELTYEELLDTALRLPPTLTDEERRKQAIDFAYGNVVLHNPSVTRAMVERAYDEHDATIQTQPYP